MIDDPVLKICLKFLGISDFHPLKKDTKRALIMKLIYTLVPVFLIILSLLNFVMGELRIEIILKNFETLASLLQVI